MSEDINEEINPETYTVKELVKLQYKEIQSFKKGQEDMWSILKELQEDKKIRSALREEDEKRKKDLISKAAAVAGIATIVGNFLLWLGKKFIV